MGNAFFIPIFFVVTGFLIDPTVFGRSVVDNFGLVVAVVGALVIGKGIAAAIAARLFNYSSAARMTVWSLTLPQVAATLAATLVGFDTFNPAGERLIDLDILNVGVRPDPGHGDGRTDHDAALCAADAGVVDRRHAPQGGLAHASLDVRSGTMTHTMHRVSRRCARSLATAG
jgi:hypothetical protein